MLTKNSLNTTLKLGSLNEQSQKVLIENGSILTYRKGYLPFYLLYRILLDNKLGHKITKKWIGECFVGGTKDAQYARDFLSVCNVVDFDNGTLCDADYSRFSELEGEVNLGDSEDFSWKYGRKFRAVYISYGHLLRNVAVKKRYTQDEYFKILLDTVAKDKFWEKIITPEMLMRKFEMLNERFGQQIPLKVGDLSSISHIF